MASNETARIVSHTRIMLTLCLLREKNSWDLSVMGYIWKTSCDEFWKNTSPVYGRSSHSLMETPITRLHDVSSTFTNVFFSSSIRRSVSRFQLFHIPEWFCTPFELCVCVELTISHIADFPSQSLQVMWSMFLQDFCLFSFISPSPSLVFPLWANISWLMKPWDCDFLPEL